MLNPQGLRCDEADRARSKPCSACEGTRYWRTIRPIACAGAGVKYFGWGELLSLVTFFAAAKKVTAAPHRGSANRPMRTQDSMKATANQATAAPQKGALPKDNREIRIPQKTKAKDKKPHHPRNEKQTA
ncbi:hypothetical protein [Caballeronia sp. J97]|uniref:hypothetical protein n=1 Tax=Caballeronia sp. J97 TaxID=2805429 RepID=UPI002AB1FDDB|nr:hypothetical protein [Caballeronia sp. J97]